VLDCRLSLRERRQWILGFHLVCCNKSVGFVRARALETHEMPTFNREQIARDWANRGFSCDLWIDPPGKRWENFTHATDELNYLAESCDGRVY
jgi:hypothetical protein